MSLLPWEELKFCTGFMVHTGSHIFLHTSSPSPAYPGTFTPRPFQQSVLNSTRPHTSSLPSHPICTTVYRAMRVLSFNIYDYIKTLSVGKASSLPSHSRSIAHRSRHEMQPVIVQLYYTILYYTIQICIVPSGQANQIIQPGYRAKLTSDRHITTTVYLQNCSHHRGIFLHAVNSSTHL